MLYHLKYKSRTSGAESFLPVFNSHTWRKRYNYFFSPVVLILFIAIILDIKKKKYSTGEDFSGLKPLSLQRKWQKGTPGSPRARCLPMPTSFRHAERSTRRKAPRFRSAFQNSPKDALEDGRLDLQLNFLMLFDSNDLNKAMQRCFHVLNGKLS